MFLMTREKMNRHLLNSVSAAGRPWFTGNSGIQAGPARGLPGAPSGDRHRGLAAWPPVATRCFRDSHREWALFVALCPPETGNKATTARSQSPCTHAANCRGVRVTACDLHAAWQQRPHETGGDSAAAAAPARRSAARETCCGQSNPTVSLSHSRGLWARSPGPLTSPHALTSRSECYSGPVAMRFTDVPWTGSERQRQVFACRPHCAWNISCWFSWLLIGPRSVCPEWACFSSEQSGSGDRAVQRDPLGPFCDTELGSPRVLPTVLRGARLSSDVADTASGHTDV